MTTTLLQVGWCGGGASGASDPSQETQHTPALATDTPVTGGHGPHLSCQSGFGPAGAADKSCLIEQGQIIMVLKWNFCRVIFFFL